MRSPVITALAHPLNLAVLGLSLLAGLLAAWWLFPLGLVVWGAMVATVSRDARVQFSHRLQSREPLARRFQGYFDRVQRAQLRIFNSLSAASLIDG